MKFFIVYGVTFLLGVGLLWFIWMQFMATPEASPVEVPAATSSHPATSSATTTAATTTSASSTATATDVRIEGVFLSLQEMETQWRTAHTYLLVDDGTEIMRIDLRPLIGSTVRDVPEKLGVARGDRIEVLGRLSAEGDFRVQAINPVGAAHSE